MTTKPVVTFYHAPQTRSSGVAILLEELGVPIELRLLNLNAGEQLDPAYRAINPMGKVPAIKVGEDVVTEQVAIYIYLADLFPEAGLAPAIDAPNRGSYLRWLVFYAACFEPALIDRAMKRDPGSRAMSTYADFDTMIETLTTQLARGPYILGETFSAADILWGSALRWTVGFKLIPETPEIMAYIARITGRPSFGKVEARDREIVALQAKDGEGN